MGSGLKLAMRSAVSRMDAQMMSNLQSFVHGLLVEFYTARYMVGRDWFILKQYRISASSTLLFDMFLALVEGLIGGMFTPTNTTLLLCPLGANVRTCQ